MKIQVCTGKYCREKQSPYIIQRIERDCDFYAYTPSPQVESCFCTGNCKLAANILIDGELHSYMNPIKVSELLQKKLSSHRKTHANI